VLFRSGVHYGGRPSFLVNDIGSPTPSSGWISVEYLTSDVTSSGSINVYLIVDSDVSDTPSVAFQLSFGVFSSILELSSYSLAAGLHTLSDYAVSGFGFISDGFDVTSDFVPVRQLRWRRV
jgi:hypothetical protein